MLDGKYVYDNGTEKAVQDPFLRKNDITTFLISPQFSAGNNVRQNENLTICTTCMTFLLLSVLHSR